jgi:outer membrane protein OmpA-like peptidoglycan-associated protein
LGSFLRSGRSNALNTNDLLREPAGLSGLDYNIGHASFSPSSQKMYFTANRRGRIAADSIRTLRIMEASVTNGVVKKSEFLTLGINDSIALHPAIHPKGELLVYSAMLKGGRGDYDLYLSRRDTAGGWSSPMALDVLNTTGNEVFANFDTEGVLYFSSDGRPGLGGLDMYRAVLGADGTVKSVNILPAPINSSFDDFGWTVIPGTNNRGYFTSNRFGTDDIFGYSLRTFRTKINGPVLDRYTGLRKPGIKVRLDSITPDGVKRIPLYEAVTDKNGNYSFDVPSDHNYQVSLVDEPELNKNPDAQSHKVLADRDRSWVSVPPLFTGIKADGDIAGTRSPNEQPSGIQKHDDRWVFTDQGLIPVSRLLDEPVKSRDVRGGKDRKSFIIYFDFDSASIDLEAEAVIQSLLSYLKTRPHYSLMLQGHTDVEGSDAYNQGLSQRRSSNVRQRLMELNYPTDKIRTAHFGETLPRIQTRNKAEARMNRRVEVFILE